MTKNLKRLLPALAAIVLCLALGSCMAYDSGEPSNDYISNPNILLYVMGSITDTDGTPLEGISVTLSETQDNTKTNQLGAFSFETVWEDFDATKNSITIVATDNRSDGNVEPEITYADASITKKFLLLDGKITIRDIRIELKPNTGAEPLPARPNTHKEPVHQ